jgi:hypothetical protein
MKLQWRERGDKLPTGLVGFYLFAEIFQLVALNSEIR